MNRGIIQLCMLCCVAVSATAQVDAYSGATKPVADTVKKAPVKKTSHSDDYESFRFGGYGEMLARRMDYGINRFYGGKDGNSKTTRSAVSIPRFVLAFDYKFNEKWSLGSEIEFEAGGTGQAMELENSENGEYETEIEKGGEVALEQFHITRHIVPAFNVRAGHIIVPVGLTNYSHEPINFLGTSRPEGETTLLPSTWHETGIAFFGECSSFDYEAMIVAGLNANGFDRNSWVAGGKQGLFEEDNFNSPAYVARINYKGVNTLRIGGSIYYCNSTGSNSDKEQTYSAIDNTSLLIWSADAQIKNKFVVARANVLMGNLNGSEAITGKNAKLSNKSPYSRTGAVAKKAVAYGAECGIHVNGFFSNENVPAITPFARYEYYNSQEEGEGSQTMDARCQVSKWTFGLNWNVLPNLVVKVDYTTRQIDTNSVFGAGQYNSENEFAIGLAYVDWFYKK
ncbi:MAG: hypothetical protein IK117_11265 [Bacteroidales bacterium]|nr:hypothetical protein [Bacteroidales bacterium]